MKKILALLFLIICLQGVRIQKIDELKQKNYVKKLILGNCTSKQSSVINDAINNCEVQDLDSTARCINSYIKANTTGNQEWNVVISSNNEPQLGLQFWYFNECYSKIIDNQTFNRTYILWPDKLFLNSTQIISNTGGKVPQEEITHSKYQPNLSEQNLKTDTCSTWRKNIVNATAQYCDVKGNQIAASCISRRLRSLVSDYWNVVVSKSQNTTIAYPWFYRSCHIQLTNYGTYERNIELWKAYYD